MFGTSSEQLDHMVMDQFAHLFNEAQGWDRASYEPATKAKSHTRKRRTGSVEDVIPEGTPVEVVEYHLLEKDRICAVCGIEMEKSAKRSAAPCKWSAHPETPLCCQGALHPLLSLPILPPRNM